jgi:hypothetical protein
MHTYLEHYIDGKRLLDLTDVGRVASVMAETIIDRGFGDLSELWGSEVTLYYEGLYAGATDAVRLTLESVRFVVESVRAKWCPIRIITAFSQNYTFKKISRVYIFVNIYIGTYSETFFVVYIGYE